jgi:hypothetical protein
MQPRRGFADPSFFLETSSCTDPSCLQTPRVCSLRPCRGPQQQFELGCVRGRTRQPCNWLKRREEFVLSRAVIRLMFCRTRVSSDQLEMED